MKHAWPSWVAQDGTGGSFGNLPTGDIWRHLTITEIGWNLCAACQNCYCAHCAHYDPPVGWIAWQQDQWYNQPGATSSRGANGTNGLQMAHLLCYLLYLTWAVPWLHAKCSLHLVSHEDHEVSHFVFLMIYITMVAHMAQMLGARLVCSNILQIGLRKKNLRHRHARMKNLSWT